MGFKNSHDGLKTIFGLCGYFDLEGLEFQRQKIEF